MCRFVIKLIPPRPTFPQDMSDEERSLMDEHGRYFQDTSRLERFFCLALLWQTVELSALAFLKSIASRRLGNSEKVTHPSGQV